MDNKYLRWKRTIYSTLMWGSPGPLRSCSQGILIPFPFLTIPKTIIPHSTMASGKKAEMKVATLKGREGNHDIQDTISNGLNYFD